MRKIILTISLGAAVAIAACAGPYSMEPEAVPLPKPKPKKGGQTCPPEPDTCHAAFDAPAVKPAKANLKEQAKTYAQDADNQLSGIDTADCAKKKQMVLAALSTLTDALHMDPYSPSATYEMAVAYASIGKKKCAAAVLARLNDLAAAMPDIVQDVSKLKAKERNDPVFEAMRKEADAALP